MDSIANYMKDENDILYIVGKKQEQEKFVAFLLKDAKYPDEQIADIVGVTIDFVKRVKQKLAGNK